MITWKGPDGTGCLYANLTKEQPFRTFLANIQLPQSDDVWREPWVLHSCKGLAHPTRFRATVNGDEVGDFDTVDAASAAIETHLDTIKD